MRIPITITIDANSKAEALKVQQSFETMHKHFKAKGIVKMTQLFLKDAFVRNLVKMKINKS